jgi:hypothetical protein
MLPSNHPGNARARVAPNIAPRDICGPRRPPRPGGGSGVSRRSGRAREAVKIAHGCTVAGADQGQSQIGLDSEHAAVGEAEGSWPRKPFCLDRAHVFSLCSFLGTIRSHSGIPDCLADPEYNVPDVLKVAGNRAMLGVPLLREGTVYAKSQCRLVMESDGARRIAVSGFATYRRESFQQPPLGYLRSAT